MFAKRFLDDVNRASLVQCLLFLAAMSIVFAVNSPAFISPVNITNILTASSVIGLMSIGATFVIASGAIDLATASTMGLASVVCAWSVQTLHLSGPAPVLIATAVGALCGALAGLLVNLTRAPSFIITLGMLSINRALAFIITGGIPIYGLEEHITKISDSVWVGLPFPAAIMLLSMVVGHVLLTKTQFGAHMLLLGDNAGAAEAMGILVPRLRLAIFTSPAAFLGCRFYLHGSHQFR